MVGGVSGGYQGQFKPILKLFRGALFKIGTLGLGKLLGSVNFFGPMGLVKVPRVPISERAPRNIFKLGF